MELQKEAWKQRWSKPMFVLKKSSDMRLKGATYCSYSPVAGSELNIGVGNRCIRVVREQRHGLVESGKLSTMWRLLPFAA